MKQLYAKLLLLALCAAAALPTRAYDCEVDGIYYNLDASSRTASVTYSYYNSYAGNVVIPSTVSYNGQTYSVTSIGYQAFRDCTGLTSVTIGNGVTIIGQYAFSGCTGLTSVTIPNSVTSIGGSAFRDCTGLTNVTIGNGVTGIGDDAFKGCIGLTSVTIPDSVTSIGNESFLLCNSLDSVYIPDGLEQIGLHVFEGSTKVYVNSKTKGLFALWTSYYIPIDKITGKEMVAPKVSPYYTTTQTSISLPIDNKVEGYSYSCDGEPFEGNTAKLEGLCPDTRYNPVIMMSYGDVYYTLNNVYKWVGITTKPINPHVIAAHKTATSLVLVGSYIEGDAIIIKEEMIIGYGEKEERKDTVVRGLIPNTSYRTQYIVTVECGKQEKYERSFIGTTILSTEQLEFTTLQPKVISYGNVIVAAESNIDDEETNVGFEWRRTDWTDDFASNTGAAYLFNGMMEGYIRNLYTEKLWKYRPYYESADGYRYYGEWVGIDPTNTSYFEPTVHTYATATVNGNEATVRGYAMRGTDNVGSQGFMYWPVSNGGNGNAAPAVPQDAMRVEATGTVMQASLTGLNYETDYCYVAYVTTTEGETFYGEQQLFRTGMDTSGVVAPKAAAQATVVAYYDLRGRRHDTPQPGLNIVLMSDGTTRKVVRR